MRPRAPARQAGFVLLAFALLLTLLVTTSGLLQARVALRQATAARNQWQGRRLRWLVDDALARARQALYDLPPLADLARDSLFPFPGGGARIHLERHAPPGRPDLFHLEVTARTGAGGQAYVGEWVRRITVLQPAALAGPPLWLDGCLEDGPPQIMQATAGATDLLLPAGCSAPAGLRRADASWSRGRLWDALFRLSQPEFRRLATAPAHPASYHLAQAGELDRGRWTLSLGSARHPALLVIPAALGCPPLAGGAHIVGLVYYAASCTATPVAWGPAEVDGLLAIAGGLHGAGQLRLHAIGLAPGQPAYLYLPALGLETVAGGWRDFR